MAIERRLGYIWPVKKEMGFKVFEEVTGHFEYGYDRPRFPVAGEILFFYSDKQLLGSLPVDQDARPANHGDQGRGHRKWKYIVGVDGSRKIRFDPPIPIQELGR